MMVAIPVVVMMQGTARDAADLYAPDSEATRATDALVQWAATPFEIRTWLRSKLTPPHTGHLSRDLPVIVSGAYDPERDRGGHEYRWTTDRLTLFVNADANSLRFTLHALSIERPRRPFHVQVFVEHTLFSEATLETDTPQSFLVPLRARPSSPDMTKVEIRLDHTWSPGGNDRRLLGVQLADLEVRSPEP
jgi:hypothetical protein